MRNAAIFFCCLILSAATPGCGEAAKLWRIAGREPKRTQPKVAGTKAKSAVAVALKPAPAAADVVPPANHQAIQPQLLLRKARAALDGRKTISATIHQRIHLYGQELVGKGEYVQGPAQRSLLKLDLTVNVGDRDFYIQQRCDGNFYWVQKCVDGIPKLTRIDVKRTEAARAAHANTNLAPQVSSLPTLGLGGVASLLEQLDTWCVFLKVSQVMLRGAVDTPVYVLEGAWKPERLLFWLPDQKDAFEKGRPINIEKLPPMVPDRIIVFLGRDDLFPRRIDYCASESRMNDSDDSPPLVRIHFQDIQFDQPIDAASFTFDSPVVAPLDDTDGYLLRHGW